MNIQPQRPAAAQHLGILALALSTMVVSAGAQAQASAARYAYKELPKPTAAAYCGAPFFINNKGQIVVELGNDAGKTPLDPKTFKYAVLTPQ